MAPEITPGDGDVAPTEPLTDSREQLVERAFEYRLTLVVHYLDGAEVARLLPGAPVVVGRGRPSNLRIPDATLSREHARFTVAGSHVLVEDLGSTKEISTPRGASRRGRGARRRSGASATRPTTRERPSKTTLGGCSGGSTPRGSRRWWWSI